MGDQFQGSGVGEAPVGNAGPKPGWRGLGAWFFLVLVWGAWVNQTSVEWSLNPQYQYGWGVPFLALYLAYLRVGGLPMPAGETRIGVGARLALGLMLVMWWPMRWLQEANPDWRLITWVQSGVVVGLTAWVVRQVAGPVWLRGLGFSLGFLLLAVPWPSFVENAVVQGLTQWVSGLTVEAMNWLGIPAKQRGNLIELPGRLVGVNEACSGVRSMQSILLASVFLGELWRLRVGRRVVLVVVSVGVALALNVGRAIGLTWMAARHGTSAMQVWHDPAGWVILTVAVILLWVVGWGLRRGVSPEAGIGAVGGWPGWRVLGGSGRVRRLCVYGAVWIVLGEVVTEGFYRLHEVGLRSRGRLVLNWPEEGRLERRSVSAETRALLRSDEQEAAVWERPDGTVWQIFLIGWRPGRASSQVGRVHRPDVCLPAVGLRLVGEEPVRLVGGGESSMALRTYRFENESGRLHVYYGVWQDRGEAGGGNSGVRPGEDPMHWRVRVRDALQGRRHTGQQVLEVAIAGVGLEEGAAADRMFGEFFEKQVVLGRR